MNQNWVVFKYPSNNALHFIEAEEILQMPIEQCGKESGFYFAPFNNQTQVYSLIGKAKVISSEQVSSFKCWFLNKEQSPTQAKEHYINLVAKAVQLMNLPAPPFQKVVLANSKFISQEVNATATFLNLCKHFPNAFVYLLHTHQFGLWLGASPELLVGSVGSKQYQTMSLAGTLGEDRNLWTEKEREEQRLVTKYIESSLTELNLPYTTDPTTELISGNLRHLMNKIRFEMPLIRMGEYLKRLHPTPAVGGLPKTPAMEFIDTHENLNRSLYAGFLGYVSKEQTQIHVNLRCAQVISTGLLCYAGAGITHLSVAEKEWQETQRKMEAVSTRIH